MWLVERPPVKADVSFFMYPLLRNLYKSVLLLSRFVYLKARGSFLFLPMWKEPSYYFCRYALPWDSPSLSR